VVDVTSKSKDPMYIQFSPFHPLPKSICVPGQKKVRSHTVDGIWQGLKVFENHDIDPKKFKITNMKGLKRTVKKFGKVKGHRLGSKIIRGASGPDGAREKIYKPLYTRVLEGPLKAAVTRLLEQGCKTRLCLMDYFTNADTNIDKPLSHAALLKEHLISRHLADGGTYEDRPPAASSGRPRKRRRKAVPKATAATSTTAGASSSSSSSSPHAV
jgi:hypothetical protein